MFCVRKNQAGPLLACLLHMVRATCPSRLELLLPLLLLQPRPPRPRTWSCLRASVRNEE